MWNSVRLSGRAKARLLKMFVLGVPVLRRRFSAPASTATMEPSCRLCRVCCGVEEQLRESFTGAPAFDETNFGGARNGKRGWSAAGTVIVFGVVKRNSCLKAIPIATRAPSEVLHGIQAHARGGSLYYTDESRARVVLHMRSRHVMIRKEKRRSLGRDHINRIEGFWSYAKNWLHPYRGVPSKYFHL